MKGLLGIAALAGTIPGSSNAAAAATKLKLAFCGQLLCVIPYAVTRTRGHFAEQGLDLQLVYTRGGNAAMQALGGGSVDNAGTTFDVDRLSTINEDMTSLYEERAAALPS